jgi:hypothetical protein
MHMDGELHVPASLPPGENPGTPEEGLVGPKVGLDVSEKRNIFVPAGIRTLNRQARRLATIPTTQSWL